MPQIYVFYQYLHPDPNVSSIHLSELCSGLVERGWRVTAFPGNRNIESPDTKYAAAETWHGVLIKRMWRPRWGRSSGLGRICNAAWMIGRWSLLALRFGTPPDAILIGTDPILSIVLAAVWRFLHPTTRIAHWCFDLYPEAAYADGVLRKESLFAKLIEAVLTPSYAACDLIADLGPCMRVRLQQHGNRWEAVTLVPWALAEPHAPLPIAQHERAGLFSHATLALMYSGTFGRAHSLEDLLALMKELEGHSIHLAISVKGQRAPALRAAASGLGNVTFVPFAAKEDLEARLASTDIHVVSLREEWTGMVIPSKFFGALAVGRPVLFCGSAHCALAIWIRHYDLGWVLEPGHATQVASLLKKVLDDPASLQAMRERCHRVYHQHFSRQITLDGWNTQLRALLPAQP